MVGISSDTGQAATDSLLDGFGMDVDVEFDFISPDRKAMLASGGQKPSQYPVRGISPFDMDVDFEGALASQGTGANGPNPFESLALPEAPARVPRSNLDQPPRPIRQHRPRQAPFRNHDVSDSRGDFYTSKPYFDRDDARADRNWSPSRLREDTPETLKQKALGNFVAVMADEDVKMEREDKREDRRDDRRDRGGHRGGNNKRRRDGEFKPGASSTRHAEWLQGIYSCIWHCIGHPAI
jgi:hypothetical protein